MIKESEQPAAVQTLSPPPLYILGVDLGQAQDFTALCVLEKQLEPTGETESYDLPGPAISGRILWDAPTRPVYRRHYAARHLERLAKGTSYPKQVERIKTLYERLRVDTGIAPRLVVDQTGVGRPVVDMLRSANVSPAAVTITGGDTVTQDGLNYRVPKKDLVAATQVLLQTERLKIARALPDAQTLMTNCWPSRSTSPFRDTPLSATTRRAGGRPRTTTWC